MKKIMYFFPLIILSGFGFIISTTGNYTEGKHFDAQINDSTQITIIQVLDKKTNAPVYYYSNLNVHACNTGECKLIEMTMYWDIFGHYFKYSVPKNNPLTKVNHKAFSKSDYVRLHKILNDTTSKLKKLSINNLTEKQVNKKYKVDGVTGASIKLVDKTKIKGAIKTSFTLWHIANFGEPSKKILAATNQYFKDHNSNPSTIETKPKISKSVLQTKNINLTALQILLNTPNLKLSKVIFDDDDADKKDKMFLINDFCLRNQHQNCKTEKWIKPVDFFKN
jgi:hypothetical protein